MLTPLNYRLGKDPSYASDYAALVEAIRASDAALMTIKMIARRNWHDGEQHTYSTWYAPFDEQRYITAAVAWLLNGHPEVTGIATAGETRLLQRMAIAERERADLTADQAAQILDEVTDYASRSSRCRSELPESSGSEAGKRLPTPEVTTRLWRAERRRCKGIGTSTPPVLGVGLSDPWLYRALDAD